MLLRAVAQVVVQVAIGAEVVAFALVEAQVAPFAAKEVEIPDTHVLAVGKIPHLGKRDGHVEYHDRALLMGRSFRVFPGKGGWAR